MRFPLPPWFRAPPVLAGFVCILGAVWVLFGYFPLWHTDLWGHLAYGRLIVESGAIPQSEPFMPLAAGVELIDTAWLSQTLGYFVYRLGGVAALGAIYATAVTFSLAVLLWCFYRRSGSAWISLAGLAVFIAAAWQQLVAPPLNALIRPQLAGLICMTVLLAALTNRGSGPYCRMRIPYDSSRSTARTVVRQSLAKVWRLRLQNGYWMAMPALFVLWANLHGSFAVGLAVLAAFCAGRALDVARRTRAPAAVLRDARVRRYSLLLVLTAAAALLNPYGPRLYVEVLTFAGHPNLGDLVEWHPLTLRMKQGRAAAIIALALIVLYRATPRRVSASEVLLLAGLGAAALWFSRMILWWAPVAAWCGVLHAAAVWHRRRRARPTPEPRPSSRHAPRAVADHGPAHHAAAHAVESSDRAEADGTRSVPATLGRPSRRRWAALCVGLACMFFAVSPAGREVLFGRELSAAQNVSRQTPLGAVAWLWQNPRRGLVLNAFEWGDFLMWAGPPETRVFVTSHAHLVPPEVWRDYLAILDLQSGWEALLNRYGVETVVLSRRDQPRLTAALRAAESWQPAYEDEQAVVFVRKTTGSPSKRSRPAP